MSLSSEQRGALSMYTDGSYSCDCPGTCPVLPCTNDREDLFVVVEEMLAKAWELGRRYSETTFIQCPDDNPYKES